MVQGQTALSRYLKFRLSNCHRVEGVRRMKVAVGLSGGVDSTVAALLLKEQGHEVVGVTMTLGRADEAQTLGDAQTAADRLGIPLEVFDFSTDWHTQVFEYLRRTYLGGQTPNPCVRCNETVKFGLLPQCAFELGCERFATGHYARIAVRSARGAPETVLPSVQVDGRTKEPVSGAPCAADEDVAGATLLRKEPVSCAPRAADEDAADVTLLRAVDKSKDQSYFLYRVKPEILAKTIFPLGELTKAEVREKARAFGLDVADKNDSQDFCGGDPMAIVNAEPREGNIVTVDGKILGKHQGYWNYTIGKRKGLGIGGGIPYYVVGLRAETNEVVVGFKEQTVVYEFKIADVVGAGHPGYDAPHADEPGRGRPGYDEPLMVKVRSAGEPKGPVFWEGDTVRCPEGLTGVAPGQSAVFFRDDAIVGGGIIV